MRDNVAFPGPVPYEVYRAQQAQKAAVEAAEKPLDVTVPGGKYTSADGTEVDANGQPLKAGEVDSAPAGSHAMLGAPAEIVYAELLAKARAEAAAEVEAVKRAEARRATAEAESAKEKETAAKAEATVAGRETKAAASGARG